MTIGGNVQQKAGRDAVIAEGNVENRSEIETLTPEMQAKVNVLVAQVQTLLARESQDAPTIKGILTEIGKLAPQVGKILYATWRDPLSLLGIHAEK